jgi:hypothetical protein
MKPHYHRELSEREGQAMKITFLLFSHEQDKTSLFRLRLQRNWLEVTTPVKNRQKWPYLQRVISNVEFMFHVLLFVTGHLILIYVWTSCQGIPARIFINVDIICKPDSIIDLSTKVSFESLLLKLSVRQDMDSIPGLKRDDNNWNVRGFPQPHYTNG